MTRAEFEKIKKKYMIFDCDIDDVLSFVEVLLHYQAKEIEEKEPYAWRTVQEIENAAHHVWNLQDYIGEVTEDEV